MKAIAQKEIISLVSDINAFVDHSESLISQFNETVKSRRTSLQKKNQADLSALESDYFVKCAVINGKSDKILGDARQNMEEINFLDARLSRVDKYYAKNKNKKEPLLAGKTSETYADTTDYFDSLEKINSNFSSLSKKYSENILPRLLNGLDYLFSSKRKKDYEELIVLRNSVAAFVQEMEEELPAIKDENLASLKETFMSERSGMIARQAESESAFEAEYARSIESLVNVLYTNLDNILPDEFVSYLHAITANHAKAAAKVNASGHVQDQVLNMAYIDYPLDLLVQSHVLASILKEKCSSLMVDKAIRFPVILSSSDAPVWLIENDHSGLPEVQALTHSVMFGVLSAYPVAHLTYAIVDPENRGNSISPFFEAKKKLPELFGEKIFISRDDIIAKINQLNEKIEQTLQDKLGTQYNTIFDYAEDHNDEDVNIELLVLYDFPKGFDDRLLSDLRNILRNGSRCGIYTLISYLPEADTNFTNEFQKSIQSIIELSTVIRQSGPEFLYHGLPLVYDRMPEKAEFSRIFSKYMLVFEGIKNRGIAFSPLVRKLVEAEDSIELDEHIVRVGSMIEGYENDYARVPALDAVFPSLFVLGNVLYPSDIFSDAFGYRRILDSFGKANGRGGREEFPFVQLPLAFSLKNSFNLFLNCPDSSSQAILDFSHHVIWSFLSFIPVTKVNVCVFDSEQRGNSIIPFLDFRKRSPETFDHKIYTGPEAMVERLRGINAHIDEFIQEKLGSQYQDIFDYNQNTPNRAEPITLLLLYDFPSGMDGRSLDLLTNILRNGNKCGVFTLICYNPEITFSRYESIDERLEQILSFCSAIEYRDGSFNLLPYNLQIEIPALPQSQAIDSFISSYVEISEIIKKQGLSFRDILAKDLFSLESSKSLKIPIGVGDGDSIIDITIGQGSSHHGLIAGATGSGKSTLLHTLIMSGMLHYLPEQLHLYLMDFKSGTEFKIYESAKLPHIQLLALDAMQEFGESILENLVSEMEIRSSLFKDAGQTSLEGYKEITGKPLPRILVIMDEFQILFNDSTNRRVAMNCAELAKRIVTEGRAFGIHLLMATQSTKVISDLTLSHGTIEQMRIRIGLKCGENDARYLFSDQNDAKALNMMKGPIGTAVMNLDYTEQNNIGFRAAYCDDPTQREYLDLISETFATQESTLQIFEGSRTTPLFNYFSASDIGFTDKLPVRIHMGSLIKVAPPFEIVIDKKKRHNLLVCGSNAHMANTLANNYILSALLNEHSTVYCIDGDKLVGDDESSAFYNALGSCGERFKVARDRGEIIRFIDEVYEKFQLWKKENSDDVVFIVFKNLQFLDIVKTLFKGERIDESEYLDRPESVPEIDPANPFASVNELFSGTGASSQLSIGEKLLKLIEEGSGFGIHFVVTSLDYPTVKEYMYYGENILTKFPERIIFSLGEIDSDQLIENVSVSSLRDNTVYFTDGVRNTFQLKPYITPGIPAIAEFFQ